MANRERKLPSGIFIITIYIIDKSIRDLRHMDRFAQEALDAQVGFTQVDHALVCEEVSQDHAARLRGLNIDRQSA